MRCASASHYILLNERIDLDEFDDLVSFLSPLFIYKEMVAHGVPFGYKHRYTRLPTRLISGSGKTMSSRFRGPMQGDPLTRENLTVLMTGIKSDKVEIIIYCPQTGYSVITAPGSYFRSPRYNGVFPVRENRNYQIYRVLFYDNYTWHKVPLTRDYDITPILNNIDFVYWDHNKNLKIMNPQLSALKNYNLIANEGRNTILFDRFQRRQVNTASSSVPPMDPMSSDGRFHVASSSADQPPVEPALSHPTLDTIPLSLLYARRPLFGDENILDVRDYGTMGLPTSSEIERQQTSSSLQNNRSSLDSRRISSSSSRSPESRYSSPSMLPVSTNLLIIPGVQTIPSPPQSSSSSPQPPTSSSSPVPAASLMSFRGFANRVTNPLSPLRSAARHMIVLQEFRI